MKWYYSNNEEAIGPLDFQEILTLVKPETLVWCDESIEEWIEAKEHPLLKDLFEISSLNNNSEKKQDEAKYETAPPPAPPKRSPSIGISFEITLILKTDWKTKGLGNRGKCHLYVENKLVETLSLDGFEIKARVEKEDVEIIFLPDFLDESDVIEYLTEGYLEEFELFTAQKYTKLQLPKLDGLKNHKIYLEYGETKKSIFTPEYGIKPNPISIEHY